MWNSGIHRGETPDICEALGGMRYFFCFFCFLVVGWAQKVRARAQCAGPACTEKVEVQSESPRRRTLRRAEARVDKYGYPRHSRRAERFRVQVHSPRHKPLERQEAFRPYEPSVAHRQRAERFFLSERFPTRRVVRRAERQRLPPPTVDHSLRAERHKLKEKPLRHQPAPEGILYAQRPIRRRPPSRSACAPPPIKHRDFAESAACTPPSIRHARPERRQTCATPPPRHRNFDRYACDVPTPYHRPQKHYERQSCAPLPIRHKNFDRYACSTPVMRHRSPAAYDVPCDAQRRGVMTATERLAHDLRYLFTNHKKHCEVMSAYSGVSIGEWVNTETYGRVPVAGYVMGQRVYVFAHFYDRKARPLKKPRLERRKVLALKQLEVWVLEPARGRGSRKRRYIRGLPGIEGFGDIGNMQLVRKRLSVEETRAVQIEKFIRKRQIAWLVRAYPEERVRLPDWLRKYAGPKPAHFWPSVDYRLLEIW